MPVPVLRPYEATWEDWTLGGGPLAAFEDPSLPLEVEIGPGDDDFLLDSAIACPEHNWLGIEYSRKRVRRYVRRIERKAPDIPNLRLIWRPARELVRPFLTPELVRAFHIYFPDPWPKAHHARYRLMTPAFVEDIRDSLLPGGYAFLATDSAAYVEEIFEAFGAVPGLHVTLPAPGYARRLPLERYTVFEERWRSKGRDIYYVEFQKASPPSGPA